MSLFANTDPYPRETFQPFLYLMAASIYLSLSMSWIAIVNFFPPCCICKHSSHINLSCFNTIKEAGFGNRSYLSSSAMTLNMWTPYRAFFNKNRTEKYAYQYCCHFRKFFILLFFIFTWFLFILFSYLFFFYLFFFFIYLMFGHKF